MRKRKPAFTFTPYDKALAAFILPLIGTAIEKFAAGASTTVVILGFVMSLITGVGVYLKSNAA